MKKILVIIFCMFMFGSSLYANDDSEPLNADKQKTIKELKESIEDLDKVKHDLLSKIEEEYLDKTIKSYLKEDLTTGDLELLEQIVIKFSDKKDELEAELFETSKKLGDTETIYNNLLLITHNFYEDLLDFVAPEYYTDYLAYVTTQVNSYIEEKEIDSDIIKKSEIVNEKITVIEEKILEHKSYLEETLSELINTKIDEKIGEITNGSKYTSLTEEEKKELIDKMIVRIKQLQNDFIIVNYSMGVTANVKASNEKKIEICNLIVNKFEALKTGLAVSE